MRPTLSFHPLHTDQKAIRLLGAAVAVAGLIALAACADNGAEKTLTAPAGPRNATTQTTGFGFAGQIQICVSSPVAGTYTFSNSGWNNNHDLNNVVDGGDGGDLLAPNNGTTVWTPAKGVSTAYPVAVGACNTIVSRPTPSLHEFSFDPLAGFGPTLTDDYQAVNVTLASVPVGAVFDHVDCVLDAGVHAPSPCDASSLTTRALANADHGVQVTYVFRQSSGVIPLFVIGDIEPHRTPGVGRPLGDIVNFWGSQWWKNNPMTQFHTKGWESFKGYAGVVDLNNTSTANPCGTWMSRVGNSPPPPQTIPEYVGIIVTNNVIKMGPNEGGGIQQILIVRSDGGYGPNPGHDGNGPVVSIQCPAQAQ